MKINDDSKDITVEAVANDANAKIEVIGNNGIKAGENLVSVIVSDSRETTVYEILINATVEKTIISNVENNDKIQQVKNGVLEFFKDENKVIALLVAVAVILIIIIICIIKKISGKNRADKNREKLRKRAK